MRFQELRIRNFLSFGEEQTIQLGNAGLAVVLGDNKDSTNADSNGSGKSAIMEALVWCLWGTTLRKLKADEVVNRLAKKDCSVSVIIEDDDGATQQVYEITRSRHDPTSRKSSDLSILVNGQPVTAGINTDTQQIINTVVGMDIDTFTQSVLLSSGTKSFCDMTDGEQKSVLDDILQLDALGQARKIVRRRITQRQNEAAEVNARLETWSEQRDDMVNHLAILHRNERELAEVKRRNRIEQEIRKADIMLKLEELCDTASYQEAKEHADEVSRKLDGASRQETKLVEQLTTVAVKASEDRFQYEQKLATLAERKRQLTNDSTRINSMAGTVCPTCTQMVMPEMVDHCLDEWDDKIKNIVALEEKIQKAINGIDAREKRSVSAIQKKRAAIRGDLDQLRNQQRMAQEALSKTSVALARIFDMEDAAAHVASNIASLRSEHNPYTGMVSAVEKDLLDLQKKIVAQNYRARALGIELEHLIFWDTGFGNGGMKSYMLDGVVPFLTKRAQRYADILSGGDLSIEFSTQSQLKSGEWRDQFQVSVTNSQGADVYKGNSSGEKRRSDIAVGWALGDLAATRAKKPIRFKGLDEPFENLDETGEDAVIKLLHSVLNEYETVLCITHSSHLRNQFPKEIRVVKENGFSRIQT